MLLVTVVMGNPSKVIRYWAFRTDNPEVQEIAVVG
jgi:hypothetical protein